MKKIWNSNQLESKYQVKLDQVSDSESYEWYLNFGSYFFVYFNEILFFDKAFYIHFWYLKYCYGFVLENNSFLIVF